jgi:hypothetical protein
VRNIVASNKLILVEFNCPSCGQRGSIEKDSVDIKQDTKEDIAIVFVDGKCEYCSEELRIHIG